MLAYIDPPTGLKAFVRDKKNKSGFLGIILDKNLTALVKSFTQP